MPERKFLAKLQPQAARLLRVVHELSFARDLQTVMATVRGAARELTGADGVTFVLRETDSCYYADEDAIAPLWKGKRFPIDACISGWVMTHNEATVIPDIYRDARVPADAYRPTFVKSLAMVPVRAPEPIAAIGVYWATAHAATDDELGALVLLADSAALALTNAQLYQNLAASLTREKVARARLEKAISTKDEFLGLVAHELRQPLHAVLAALRLMAARTSRANGERARDVIERQVEYMSSIVEDLVDAARIVRGQISLKRESIDLRDTIAETADSLHLIMTERSHEFIVTAPEHPVVLQADPLRLQQIFTNLLTNAAKYTEPGGRITLTAVNGDRQATVTIADTGRGIDTESLPHIFDLFTRVAPDVRGFGVGLAVARRLVELHGGTIEARSAGPGKGSEFVVSLPLFGGAAQSSDRI